MFRLEKSGSSFGFQEGVCSWDESFKQGSSFRGDCTEPKEKKAQFANGLGSQEKLKGILMLLLMHLSKNTISFYL